MVWDGLCDGLGLSGVMVCVMVCGLTLERLFTLMV